MNQPRSLLAPAFCLVCLGILYGSLFPFHFVAGLDDAALGRFLASWRDVNSMGDILGNVVLFFPYGYIACLLAARAERGWLAASLLALLGVGLALFCQMAQLFTPGRDPSLADLVVDTLGIALGWIAGRWLPLGSSAAAQGLRSTHHLPLALAGLWLGSQLLPLVPSIDLQLWKDALKPLFFPQRWYWQGAMVSTLCWLVCFHLLEHRVGWRLTMRSLLLGSALIVALKIVVVGNRLELVFVSALLCAVVLWSSLARQWRGEYLACALLLAFALDMVAPLSPRQSPQAFSWLPFAGYLQGSMLINTTALCRKLFVFGAFALLFLGERPTRLSWALGLALCLLLLEFAQRFVGYGTPALTDPLLFLVTAWFVVAHSARFARGERA